MPSEMRELIRRACEYLGIANPRVVWSRRPRARDTWGYGSWRDHRIEIRAGSDPFECRLTILHELAHLAAPGTDHAAHPPAFWRTCRRLYRWAGLPRAQCRASEARYRKSSLKYL